MLRRNQLDFTRCLAELDDGFDELALGLQVDAVIVETDDPLDCTRQKLVLGVNAGGFVEQFDVKAFFLEIAERLGELRGQVDLLLDNRRP